MSLATVAFIAAALLCLALDAKRLIGVLGVALLIYLHPVLSAALLILGCAIFYFLRRRRSKNAPPAKRDP